ncbi:sucrose-phosphate phosphatase [Leptolyngbya sp. FACHB-261]|uniref:sucrose-phosphate phosphatase n=1 Tax=Leptolyngbya sp. FACHB-261 TaxID=2692806 RepID=UPI001681FA67|nr:sucrose-phosphate phosphatase [Leptolyngbya sp. FACHB-261]MBD2102282.1 sucrose-phosphate phosphatase [Leptolyngbya sp. FACHB-261]
MSKFLLVTDLDNTLVGDDAALAQLNQTLEQHRAAGSLLVYSTGRSRVSYQKLQQAKQLLEPDALVTSVGTEIYRPGSVEPEAKWSEFLAPGWDRALICAVTAHFADLEPQPDSEQNPFKVSFWITELAAREVVPRLEQALQAENLDVQLIYSGSRDLDILPAKGNKGRAMAYVRELFGFTPEQTVACGDSGNDQALMMGEERCVIVANAHPELLTWYQANRAPHRYLAHAKYAAGIAEGLAHFGFL